MICQTKLVAAVGLILLLIVVLVKDHFPCSKHANNRILWSQIGNTHGATSNKTELTETHRVCRIPASGLSSNSHDLSYLQAHINFLKPPPGCVLLFANVYSSSHMVIHDQEKERILACNCQASIPGIVSWSIPIYFFAIF